MSTLRNTLLLSTTVLTTPVAGASESSSPQITEEIVVVGQALALERAADFKRAADNVLDTTVQDDIGRLPDLNTASVIRRMPGVGVQNDQAEARFAIVRGLNPTYNRTTVDGNLVASPERGGLGRAVPLDVIPASLLARLDVHKTVTPDMDPNAIGGSIDLVTRSAFDQEETFVYGSAFLGDHEQSGRGGTLSGSDEEQPWRANAAGGWRLGSDGEFGLVAAVDYSIRNFEIPQIEVDDADYTEFDAAGNNVGLGNGNGTVVATNNRVFFYNNERERVGGHLKLEWQPSERLYAHVGGYHFEFNDDERRDENRYELGTGTGSDQPAVIRDQSGFVGVSDTGFGIVGIGRFVLDRTIDEIHGGIEWQAADTVTVELNASYSEAELDNPEVFESFQTDTGLGARFDVRDLFPRFQPLDPQAFNDPASYTHQNRGTLQRFVDDEALELRGDVDWELPLGAATVTLEAGGLYRNREKNEGFDFTRFVTDDVYTLADAVNFGLAGEEFQGNNSMLFRVDIPASDQVFNAGGFSQSAASSSRTRAEEEVTAVYGMGRWSQGPFSVLAGLRYERTDWEGGDPTENDIVEGDYDDLLLGLHGRYDVNDSVVLRAAFSQTIGRPNLSELTRGETVDLANNSISRSNPDLDPRKSNNLDLSAEWYVPHGLLAITGFYKDIEDEIFTLTSDTSLVVDGVTFDEVTQPENAEDAEILGVELQYQQNLRFLPAPFNGLGVALNATLLDTEYVVPLGDGETRETGFFQQPDELYNATVYYAGESFEVRLSYNYTDRFLDLLVPNNPNRDEFWDEREQVDLQARVNLTDRISLIVEGVNLTDEGRRELSGPGGRFLQEDAEFGRTFWIGINASL